MSCILYILENNNKKPGYYEVAADMLNAVGSVPMLCMNGTFIPRLFLAHFILLLSVPNHPLSSVFISSVFEHLPYLYNLNNVI